MVGIVREIKYSQTKIMYQEFIFSKLTNVLEISRPVTRILYEGVRFDSVLAIIVVIKQSD